MADYWEDNDMLSHVDNSKRNSLAVKSDDQNQKAESTSKRRSFTRVFDLEAEDLGSNDNDSRQSPFEGRFPINIGITGYVATTGETLNIPDAYKDPRFDPSVDEDNPTGFKHKSILCMPIRNASHEIIGVSQLINKTNNRPFNKNDENLFEVSHSNPNPK